MPGLPRRACPPRGDPRGDGQPIGMFRLFHSENKPGERRHLLPGLRTAFFTKGRAMTVRQDGDDGVTVVFPVDQFDAVAALLHPRRRRVVSDAERERLRTLSAKYGFQHTSGAPCESEICVGTV